MNITCEQLYNNKGEIRQTARLRNFAKKYNESYITGSGATKYFFSIRPVDGYEIVKLTYNTFTGKIYKTVD